MDGVFWAYSLISLWERKERCFNLDENHIPICKPNVSLQSMMGDKACWPVLEVVFHKKGYIMEVVSCGCVLVFVMWSCCIEKMESKRNIYNFNWLSFTQRLHSQKFHHSYFLLLVMHNNELCMSPLSHELWVRWPTYPSRLWGPIKNVVLPLFWTRARFCHLEMLWVEVRSKIETQFNF